LLQYEVFGIPVIKINSVLKKISGKLIRETMGEYEVGKSTFVCKLIADFEIGYIVEVQDEKIAFVSDSVARLFI
jgi:hypothetical protein